MRLKQVNTLMSECRKWASLVGPNNKRISDWVDRYLDDCILNGRAVTVLTQWCISKDLESRWMKTGNNFVPTKEELKLFEVDIPRVISLFNSSGLCLEWWITFNRSYLDSGRIDPGVEFAYEAMIKNLAEPLEAGGQIILVNWEDEVLMSRPKPNLEVLNDSPRFISGEAFSLELERHSAWSKIEAGLKQSDRELKEDVLFQIACEVEEGRLLASPDSPIGNNFILIPLEAPERYDFFMVMASEFKSRIMPILRLYPWRLS